MQMNTRAGFGLLRGILLLSLFCLWAGDAMSAPGTNGAPETNAADGEGRAVEAVVIGTQESLRSSLVIQDQLNKLQATIEKDRKEAEAAAVHNMDLVEARLKLMETANASQQFEELKKL